MQVINSDLRLAGHSHYLLLPFTSWLSSKSLGVGLSRTLGVLILDLGRACSDCYLLSIYTFYLINFDPLFVEMKSFRIQDLCYQYR